LRFRNSHKTDDFKKAFLERGVSLTVLDIADEAARAVYERDLLLLRPDMHIVWRGNQPPENAAELAAIATGHGS
jgi:hypothetical protein